MRHQARCEPGPDERRGQNPAHQPGEEVVHLWSRREHCAKFQQKLTINVLEVDAPATSSAFSVKPSSVYRIFVAVTVAAALAMAAF